MVKATPGQHSIWNIKDVPEQALFWLTLWFLTKKDPKSVKEILLAMIKTSGDALERLCAAATANPITAWAASDLLSLYLERFGLLTHGQTVDFQIKLNIVYGAEFTEDIITDLLETFKPFKIGASKPSEFPSTVVLGDKSRAFKVTKGAK